MIDLIQPGLRAPKFKPHLTTVGKLTKFQGVVETLPGTALYLGPGFQGLIIGFAAAVCCAIGGSDSAEADR